MLCLLASAFVAFAGPVNLVVNGNFEQGRKGFRTNYTYSPDIQMEGTYAVGDNPQKFHPGGYKMADHTSGKGQMMILNGAPTANDVIWQANVKVTADQIYDFSGWAASWSVNPADGTGTDPNPGRFQLWVDGKAIGPVYKVDARSGIWGRFTATWRSTATKEVTIKIVNTNTVEIGNDFALDDLFFGIKQK